MESFEYVRDGMVGEVEPFVPPCGRLVDNVEEFLALVDCEFNEVQDTAEETVKYKAAVKEGNSQVVYFGKHKGKRLDEIPADYLIWACRKKGTKGFFRKFQRTAKAELGRRKTQK